LAYTQKHAKIMLLIHINENKMKKFLMMLGLLGGFAYEITADELDSPTVNSRLASSAEFPDENSFNGNGKGNSSTPAKQKQSNTNQ